MKAQLIITLNDNDSVHVDFTGIPSQDQIANMFGYAHPIDLLFNTREEAEKAIEANKKSANIASQTIIEANRDEEGRLYSVDPRGMN
jgi:hypothetical protein